MIKRLAKLLVTVLILSASNLITYANEPSSPPYAVDQLIIKFKSHIQDADKQNLLSKIQAKRLEKLDFIKAEVIHVNKSRSISAWVETLRQHPWVEYVEPNYTVRMDATESKLPNDMYFSHLWGLNNAEKQEADIDAPEAWKAYKPVRKIVVAVIDTGVDYDHPDLATNRWVNAKEDLNRDGRLTKADLNGKDDDKNGYIDDVLGWDWVNKDNDPMDDHGHGTHVAGTIAAKINNGGGVAGVAGQGYVKIMPLKFLSKSGSGYTSDAVKAVEYSFVHRAVLSNNSWGGGGPSQALYYAIQRYQSGGGLFIAAAGNSSNNNDTRPFFPAAYPLDNIISVASMTASDTLSGFSNFGEKTVHLAAPGSNIASTFPGNRYAYMSGTSMAAPHVCGVAALLWTQKTTDAKQIKAILMDSARPLPALDKKVVTGGVLNANNALTGKFPQKEQSK